MNRLKKIYQSIAGELAMIWLWIKNLCFVFLTTKSQVRVFQGYGHYWFAKKYADKRARISRINKVCGEKRHYVLPAGDYSLMVLNKLEINSLKTRHLIKRSLNINEVLKNAYYLSK